MSGFVHAQGIKTVHAGGGVKKWQNYVHVVVESYDEMSELTILSRHFEFRAFSCQRKNP